MKKTFILDTNVILHDPSCIFNFDEHDVIVPIVVLEQLDERKQGNSHVNQNARAFIRNLSKLSDNSENKLELSLGKNKGMLRIPVDDFNLTTKQSVDNQLLDYCKKYPSYVFVTQDINLRMKARAYNIIAEDYKNDKVKDPSNLPSGFEVIEDTPTDIINSVYADDLSALYDFIETPLVNNYYILKKGSQSVRVAYKNNQFIKITDKSASGIRARNLEQSLALDLLLDPNIPLVALTGISGGGKTLLSLAAALEQRKEFLKILLTRPVVPLGNDIGFLPGDIMDKLTPYMQPLYDNLDIIKKVLNNDEAINKMKTEKKIEIVALPYLRGRSLPRVFFIIDECQNLSPLEVKTIVTRAGENAKIVFTGDINQIDSPYMDVHSNGLSYLIYKMTGQSLFGHIKFTKGERSKLSELASTIL